MIHVRHPPTGTTKIQNTDHSHTVSKQAPPFYTTFKELTDQDHLNFTFRYHDISKETFRLHTSTRCSCDCVCSTASPDGSGADVNEHVGWFLDNGRNCDDPGAHGKFSIHHWFTLGRNRRMGPAYRSHPRSLFELFVLCHGESLVVLFVVVASPSFPLDYLTNS